MTDSLPVPCNKSENYNENDKNVTGNNELKYLSLSPWIVEILKSDPSRRFFVRELIQITHAKPDAVRQAVSRLSKTGKGSGPVRKIDHGMYQYAPEKELDSLEVLVQLGNWKAENLVFVTKGAQGGVLSQSDPSPGPGKGPESDTQSFSIPVRHECCPCPWKLPTGQVVTWVDYKNSTEEIRISANGAPPLNPDAVLIILRTLRDFMTEGQVWNCVSMELNIDSVSQRIDHSYSLQVIEGLLLKAYQHGYVARIEIADRRKVPLLEITQLFNALAVKIEGKEALREVADLKKEMKMLGETARTAYSVAVRERDKRIERDRSMKEVQDVPGPSLFKTGAEFKRERAGEPPPE
jgi:hypothetical protein